LKTKIRRVTFGKVFFERKKKIHIKLIRRNQKNKGRNHKKSFALKKQYCIIKKTIRLVTVRQKKEGK